MQKIFGLKEGGGSHYRLGSERRSSATSSGHLDTTISKISSTRIQLVGGGSNGEKGKEVKAISGGSLRSFRKFFIGGCWEEKDRSRRGKGQITFLEVGLGMVIFLELLDEGMHYDWIKFEPHQGQVGREMHIRRNWRGAVYEVPLCLVTNVLLQASWPACVVYRVGGVSA